MNYTNFKIIIFLLLWPTIFTDAKKRKPLPLTNAIIKRNLDCLVNRVDKKAKIGIHVISLKTGNCVYQKNSSKLFMPASNTKLFTCAAAISMLGNDFTFKTALETDGEIKSRILSGNLYLIGSGDPSLKFEDLEALVMKLRNKRIKTISGNIILDDTVFDNVQFGPGWPKEGPVYYNSPINGININHNCIKVIVSTKNQLKQPKIKLEPQTRFVAIQNRATLVNDSIQANLSRSNTGSQGLRISRVWIKNKNIIIASGKLPMYSKKQAFEFTLQDPSMYAGILLEELLAKHKIKFRGKILKAPKCKSTLLLAEHVSEPLTEIIKPILKNSDNLYADCLAKKLACKISTPGTWENGQKIIAKFIEEKIKIPKTEFHLADGSGFSKRNLVSPAHIIKLLQWVNINDVNNDFLNALPIAAVDGSLRKRMQKLESRVKAKTGTLRNATSLSGFITTFNGEQLAFSILINGFKRSMLDKYKRTENLICAHLAKIRII